MADNLVWKAFLAGDKKALSEIFLEYYDDLFRYGFKLTSDKNLVEDVIQELFLKLWKNRLQLSPVDNLKPYLFKAIRNKVIDNLNLLRPSVEISESIEKNLALVYSPEDFLITSQAEESTRHRVITALNKLPPRQREVIFLRYFEEIDFETIAQIMEVNVQSVRNTIHRGMEAMRDLMMLQPLLLLLSRTYFNLF